MKHPVGTSLAVCVLLLAASGANCVPRSFWPVQQQPPPVVFNAMPTLADVINVVNGNRSLAISIYSPQATLSGSQFPSLKSTLAVGGPRKMRLHGGTVFGPEIDLGSNDQMFWVWIKRNSPPTTLVGRHDEFATSPAARAFPIRPEFLIEAIGLVHLDPQVQHAGPFVRNDGRLEVRTTVAMPAGQQTKVLILDAHSGYIVEQQILDERGQLIARAVSSKHLRDPVSGFVLPRDTTITWPATQLSLRLEMQEVQVNPWELSAEMWTKPQYPGYPDMDISRMSSPATPAAGLMPAPTAAGTMPPGPNTFASPPVSPTGWRPAGS